MTRDTVLGALKVFLSEHHFGPDVRWSHGYILLTLNDKLQVHVLHKDGNVRVELASFWRFNPHIITDNPILFEANLAEPDSLNRLRLLLKELPNKLAKLDPRYAIPPA
jgi:hypothetical protein